MNVQLKKIFIFFLCFSFALQAQEQPSTRGIEKKEEKISSETGTNNIDKPEEKPGEKKDNQAASGENKEKKENTDEKKNEESKGTWAATFVSDYISRGLSETIRQPAAQAEFKYVHTTGLYFKSWGSNVDGTSHLLNNTCLEWDLYVGYTQPFLKTKVIYDIGLLLYYYPGGKARNRQNTSYNTLEYYVSFNYKKLECKLSLTLTDFFGNNSGNPPFNWNKGRQSRPNGHSYGSPYLEANYEFDIAPKWKGALHFGYQGVINYPQLSYVDWFAGVTHTFKWFDVTLSYVQSTGKKAYYRIRDDAFHEKRVNLAGATVVLAVQKSF